MSHYYLLLSLPPLSFKERPNLTFDELKERLALNLSAREEKRVGTLFEGIDLYNVKAFLLGAPLDERGNFDRNSLEEKLLVQNGSQDGFWPAYLSDYLQRFESTKERIAHFHEVIAAFYREKESEERGFLKEWFSFERTLKLLLTALRAKARELDLFKALAGEDPYDPIVAFVLAQKDSPDLFLPFGWEVLKILFVENGRDPEKLNRAILEYQFEKVEELEESVTPFSLEQLFAYVIKFLLVQSWFEQGDWDKGRSVVEELVRYG